MHTGIWWIQLPDWFTMHSEYQVSQAQVIFTGIEAYDLAIEEYEELEKEYSKAIDEAQDEVIKEIEHHIVIC